MFQQKKLYTLFLSTLLATSLLSAKAQHSSNSNVGVGIVNFRSCIENSELGREQQGRLEAMRNEMVASLERTDAEITDISNKLKDAEYLDSISQDAEEQLKIQYRMLTEQIAQLQNQYYQTLNQANYRMIQLLNSEVSKAAEEVAKDRGLSIVLNEDACFYFNNTNDITSNVITEMNGSYQTSLTNPTTGENELDAISEDANS